MPLLPTCVGLFPVCAGCLSVRPSRLSLSPSPLIGLPIKEFSGQVLECSLVNFSWVLSPRYLSSMWYEGMRCMGLVLLRSSSNRFMRLLSLKLELMTNSSSYSSPDTNHGKLEATRGPTCNTWAAKINFTLWLVISENSSPQLGPMLDPRNMESRLNNTHAF